MKHLCCRHPVFKIHYLMAVLVFIKSLSLLFHAMNYHFIQTKGEHVPTWAILYYVTHLWVNQNSFISACHSQWESSSWRFSLLGLSTKTVWIFVQTERRRSVYHDSSRRNWLEFHQAHSIWEGQENIHDSYSAAGAFFERVFPLEREFFILMSYRTMRVRRC